MRYEGRSDKGLSRSNNQDYFLVKENETGDLLAVVCDGVGGASHGEYASCMAAQCMAKHFETSGGFIDLEDARAWFYTSVTNTNEQVYAYAQTHEGYQGMGTTMVAFLHTKFGDLVANAGDSRAYGYSKKGVFRCITQDHTYVANLVEYGHISIQEALNHPQRHVITNAIGVWKKAEVDIFDVNDSIMTILLCSDGLHGYVVESYISSVIAQKTGLREKAKLLIDAANDAGGADNCTVLLIERDGGFSNE